jgi:GNAT superfamily N-acetyltransferase
MSEVYIMKAFEIRELIELDMFQVEEMDFYSGDCVADELESDEYAWGAFVDGELVGYCTLGCADADYESFGTHPSYSFDSLLLSDVYVLPEYRGQKCASQLIRSAISLKRESQEAVFLMVLEDSLIKLYEGLGFKCMGEGVMVLVD